MFYQQTCWISWGLVSSVDCFNTSTNITGGAPTSRAEAKHFSRTADGLVTFWCLKPSHFVAPPNESYITKWRHQSCQGNTVSCHDLHGGLNDGFCSCFKTDYHARVWQSLNTASLPRTISSFYMLLPILFVWWHLRLDEKNGRDIGMMMFMKNYHQQLTEKMYIEQLSDSKKAAASGQQRCKRKST